MSFALECIDDSVSGWRAYRDHPWIERLADGSLTLEQFVFFHEFDTSFSADMHRALALGVAKAPAGCDWARAAIRVLHETFIADKRASKEDLLARLNQARPVRMDRMIRGLSRDAYANHLLRVAWEQPIGAIAAALLPCAMFTEIIGTRFAASPPASEPEIVKWAQGYVNERDMSLTASHIEMMDTYSATGGSTGRESMRQEFTRSVAYQTRVFDAALAVTDRYTEEERSDGR